MDESKLFHGANYTPKDPNVTLLKNVAGDSQPFDWNVGVDVTRITGPIPTKNQANSFSCGGQATAYLAAVVARLNTPEFKEKSARFIYSQVDAPGGGSSDVELMKLLTEVGACDEALFPSYYSINGNVACDEPFMTDSSGITQAMKDNAKTTRFGKPVYVKRDLDSMAKAVRDHGGFILGIVGQNNGTWNSADPVPPSDDNNLWYHWMYVGRAIIRLGSQKIGAKQSWGEPIGENGWQYFGANYMPRIFTAFTFVNFNPKPNFKHTFNVNLTLGNRGAEVKALQEALKIEGCFPAEIATTEYFGNITLEAVKQFQTKYAIKPVAGYVGPITRAKLNQLFG